MIMEIFEIVGSFKSDEELSAMYKERQRQQKMKDIAGYRILESRENTIFKFGGSLIQMKTKYIQSLSNNGIDALVTFTDEGYKLFIANYNVIINSSSSDSRCMELRCRLDVKNKSIRLSNDIF